MESSLGAYNFETLKKAKELLLSLQDELKLHGEIITADDDVLFFSLILELASEGIDRRLKFENEFK